MRKIMLTIMAELLLGSILYCQTGEMKKFYSQFHPGIKQKNECDSVYNLINIRRSAFSSDFKSYKERNGSAFGFVYDWSRDESNVLSSLSSNAPAYLKQLLYYSYFDLGYGTYGLKLKPEICRQALLDIPASSVIWAMEPEFLETVIRIAGGEEKYANYIRNVVKENKDASLLTFVKNNLSPDRPLRKGKFLPELIYRDITDTALLISSNSLGRKYYLIDIWATWCKPCIDELPGLKRMYLMRNDSLEFLSISVDNELPPVRKFLETKMNFPWEKGIAISREDLMNTLGINGIPCTILISPERKILSYGYDMRGTELEKTLKKWLK